MDDGARTDPQRTPDPAVPADVRASVLGGLKWLTIARGGSEVLAFASTVVLARLVPPEQYGAAVVALVVSSIAMIAASQLVVPGLVRAESLSEDHVPTAATLQLAMALVLGAGIVAAAPALRAVTGEAPIELVAPGVVAVALAAVPNALLQRRLDFRRSSAVQFAGIPVGIAASVGAAVAGVDAEAVVLGPVVSAACTALLTIRLVGLPRPGWNRAVARELLAFGLPTGGSTALHAGFQNADYAVVAARLSAADLAFYFRAYTLSVDYQAKISRILANISFPVYSRLQSLEQIRTMRRRMVRVHVTALFPLLAGYLAVAPWFVPLVFGERWEPAVVPSQILVAAGMCAVLSTGNGALLMAFGHAKLLLWWNALHLVGYCAAVWLAAAGGIVTVAIVASSYFAGRTLLTHFFIVDRVCGIPFGDFVRDLVAGLVPSAAMFGLAAAVAAGLEASGAPGAVVVVAAPALGLVAYFGTLRLVAASTLRDFLLLVRGVVGRADTGAAERAPTPAEAS